MQNQQSSDLQQQHDLFPNFFSSEVFQNESVERYNPVDEEPLYVNAKQYSRIMKRREMRLRLEELHRLSRQRKPYLHESRHKHAMRRPRGPGGRFLTAEEIAAQKASQAETSNADRDGGDDEDVQTSPESEHQLSPLTTPTSPSYSLPEQKHHQLSMLDLSYHPHHRQSFSLSQSMANGQSIPPQVHGGPMYIHHPHHKSPIGPDPISLGNPYMHHVPHMPHHQRHQHPSYPYAMYPQDPISQPHNLRAHEMIPFGGTGAPSP